MTEAKITFETKVYENDWRFLLKTNYLDKMIDRCNCNFNHKYLFINNVNDLKKVEYYAQKKVDQGVISEYFIVGKYATKALDYFGIVQASFKGGYYYSIAELVSIFICQTDYLLHFSSDSYLPFNNNQWIMEAIGILQGNKHIIAANPVWNFNFKEAESESFNEINNFYVSQGFSDQCYLIKVADFKGKFYNKTNSYSKRYPDYGGESFEKRVDSYMREENLFRITSKTDSYIHKNFSQKRFFNLINSSYYRNIVVKKRLKL
ncbi:hypothetical protein [Leeuwenhoekiella aestuarii]|uniref:Glycosyl transferase family 2 n=1 Tax=Leeuwenhoekiella aestuarii TaxID=2249426 RepID=A0A4Q0NPZ8_9FLAO|nr:hypothetical protein [Leeuwenhoekiella aestuarii]RXG12328.1 hypothetical protein DSM04_10799 [Leeuwenhoekiella aestuarii]